MQGKEHSMGIMVAHAMRIHGRVGGGVRLSSAARRCSSAASKSVGSDGGGNSKKWIGRAVFAIPVLGTLYLGTWQMTRYQEKVKEIAARKKGISGVAREAGGDDKWSDRLLERVKVRGKYRHDLEMLVGPRSAPTGGAASGSGLMSAPGRESGFYVITPFEPLGGKLDVLLVNRGWIARGLTHQLSVTTGEVELEVVPVVGETPSGIIPRNDPSKGIWFSLYTPEMSAHASLPYTATLAELLSDTSDASNRGNMHKFELVLQYLRFGPKISNLMEQV
jgi:cytochrome oxidase assembly protein ShyY1